LTSFDRKGAKDKYLTTYLGDQIGVLLLTDNSKADEPSMATADLGIISAV
jgi:hypothetical protein